MDTVARLLEERPVFHSDGERRWDALPGTLRTIQQIVRLGDHTLETGCGASTVVFAARGAHHTSVSPDPQEHLRVQAYCDAMGIDHSQVTFIEGFSDLVLPELCGERKFDIAFIDGAHAFPYPAVDWHYVTRALNIGGRLLLDDVPIPSVALVLRYMRSDPSWCLDEILDGRAALLTLAREPEPEDWTLQPFNRRFNYTFAPLPSRIRLVANAEVSRLRQEAARRYPGLGRVAKRLARTSGSAR